MNKKRFFTALLGFALTMPMFAQYGYYSSRSYTVSRQGEDNEIYYGLRLGLALGTVNSDDPMLDGGSMQAGLNIGGIIGFQLSPSAPVYLETGLFYTEKGGKGYYDKKKFTFDLNYLEVPIVVKYKYEIDDDLSIQPFAGGYLALGVGGKMKNYGERTASSSFSDDYFKRFDGGLRLGCGVEYQMLYADLAYDFGLSNISHDIFESSHNGCFYINCGVNF